MNCSDLKKTAYAYLGCHGTPGDEELRLVDDCLGEARALARFKAVGKTYTAPLAFLQRQPYAAFLAGCSGYALVAMTLGQEIDRRIRALMQTDPVRAVVLDACAGALAEYEGDAWEMRFGEERTYRFCPGYGGSDAGDVRFIFSELHPGRIGMQLLDSGMMVPQKSMAGIVGLGKRLQKTCGACMLREACVYRREGTRCFSEIG